MAIKTRIKTEYFLGDSMKVIGELCHQLSESDQLQNSEILSLVAAELQKRPLPEKKQKDRPIPSASFMENYHSGNDLVLSNVKKENSARDRLEVIYQMCTQIAVCDGLAPHQILSLIECYLREHILEVDV